MANPQIWIVDRNVSGETINIPYGVIQGGNTCIFASDCTYDHFTVTVTGGNEALGCLPRAVESAWTNCCSSNFPNGTCKCVNLDSSPASGVTMNKNTSGVDIIANMDLKFYDTDGNQAGAYHITYVYAPQTPASGLVIQATFNVTSTTTPVCIQTCSYIVGMELNKFAKITYNGQDIPTGTTAYTFPTTGLQTVYYTLTGTSLGGFALDGCGAVEVILPEGLTEIGFSALAGNSFSGITIPSTVTDLGGDCFYDCYNLLHVTIPDSVTAMSGCFGTCMALSSVTIGSGVTVIPEFCFFNCPSLTSVTIPDNITTIQDGAFQTCTGLTELRLGSGVTEIGHLVFYNDSALTQITATSRLDTTLYYNTFEGIATGGTLYYPSDIDYSGWLSTAPYLLGYYGWNGTNIHGSMSLDSNNINVSSGSSSPTITVEATDCDYDHFTYMTGGSMAVTVTQGSGNTLIFTVPANNTSNSRVGYVYLTLYDTLGNTYQATVTVRQAAGTTPGPGPGPGPSPSGGTYVLTSLTISDNDQHRYFIEAEAGRSYTANGVTYKTVSACEARYSLYYINSYGGVDVLVFKGRGNKKTDNITRFNYSRSFRNNTLEYEDTNYLNSIETVYELQTGWMVDKQSKKMHELVESTCVYLYDAQEQEYYPVVMTDKTLDYKTYHNQNNRFYNYTIKCKLSQSRERR